MFETLFAPYQEYSAINIFLEITAVVFAVISVLYSKKNSINVYPTGIVSILIFMYLLYQWELFGDLIINIYYFIMSVYGWVLWSRKKEGVSSLKVEKISLKEYKISGVIFFLSTLLVSAVYILFEKFGYWWSYVDILTTGLFFIGMYLLARRKVEHWLFLIVGDFISIPLYYFKEYTITSMLYVIYTVIAVFGYLAWKKIWDNNLQRL